MSQEVSREPGGGAISKGVGQGSGGKTMWIQEKSRYGGLRNGVFG